MFRILQQFWSNKSELPSFFSYSQINSFKLCQEQYKIIYMNGVKKKYESIESFMGKRVHTVLEWLYKPQNKEEEWISFDRIKEEYDKDWINHWHAHIFAVDRSRKNSNPLSKEELKNIADEYYRIGKDCLASYYRRFAAKSLFMEPVLGRELEVTFNVREYNKAKECVQEYPFKGVIDRLDKVVIEEFKNNNKTIYNNWIIHDYKTGRRAKTDGQIANDLQLALYQLAIKQNFKIQDDDSITLSWHSLRHGTETTFEHNEISLNKIEQKNVNIIKSIRLSRKNDDFKPIKNHDKSAICNWCPFWEDCSAKTISNPHLKNLIKIHTLPKDKL